MQWVTRDRVKVDRVACPWLILRFVDKDAGFVFVPAAEVDAIARSTGAVPLDDPALHRPALIVRGADTDARELCPEAAGLHAVAVGFSLQSPSVYADDHALLRAEFPLYDALYEWCKRDVAERSL